MTPSEAVILRAQMVDDLARRYGFDLRRRHDLMAAATAAYDQGNYEIAVPIGELITLADAPIYVWRSDLFEAAWKAGETLPDVAPASATRPMIGLYLLPTARRDPQSGRLYRALLWNSGRAPQGFMEDWLHLYDAEPVPGAMCAASIESDCSGVPDENNPAHHVGHHDGLPMPGLREIHRSLKATWLWLDQRVAAAATGPVSRHAVKIADRSLASSQVNVVSLRRVERTAGSAGPARSVEWACQWLVNGHWRNQFYPASGDHRTIWIAPYIKGPEEAPFRAPAEPVFAVNR